jgi:hypothetical protein
MEDTAITSGPECFIVTLKIADSCGGKSPITRFLVLSALVKQPFGVLRCAVLLM